MSENDRPRYFHDDGTEFDPDLLPTPDLCVSCVLHGIQDADQEVLCNLARADPPDNGVFICYAYRPASPTIDRESVLRGLCEQAGVDYPQDSAQPS